MAKETLNAVVEESNLNSGAGLSVRGRVGLAAAGVLTLGVAVVTFFFIRRARKARHAKNATVQPEQPAEEGQKDQPEEN